MKKLLIGLIGVLSLVLLAQSPATASTAPPNSATVIMTDNDFKPESVTIQPGGSITWLNQGSNVHSATSLGGAPLPFNTGGVGPGQSASFSFGLPGTYYYTSSIDCLNGPAMAGFPCAISFLVNVTSAQAQATSAAATVYALPTTPTPTATALPAGYPQPLVTVAITDKGFSPASVTVALNGSVMFVNEGDNVHSATAQGNTSWPGFDSGGLARGQIFSVGFAQPGTFTYTSATDCLNGNATPGFNCGPYSIVVSNITLPAPPAVTPTAIPTAVGVLAAPNPNPKVNITDGGYSPNVITVKAGQSVTWTNTGTQVHTVTSDTGYLPAFDSGGLNPNQSYSVTFQNPGTFGYHSQTDVTYFQDAGCGCTAANYLLRGTVNVTS